MPLVQRVDGYAPIRDYGVIGDGRTCALVARDGAIDWLCLPNVDSPSTFARILDPERGGAFLLSPVEPFETEQSYVSGTNVLRTTFRTASGTARITDAMTLTDVAFISPLREVVRKVEALEGRVRFEWSVTPRFIYGRRDVNLSQRYGRPFFFAGKDGLAVSTWGAGETEFRDRAVGGEFELGPQETALFSLSAAFKEPVILPGRDDTERRLERAERFWAEWSGRVQHDGRWRDQVVRSALVLKLLVFAPSGAIVAAPTTSLPECYGGGRNWDYRYSWVRDASFTMEALWVAACPDEAADFFSFMCTAGATSAGASTALQIMFGIGGEHDLSERVLPHLSGWRESRPVRVGNGAWNQQQIDVYGELLGAADRLSDQLAGIDEQTRRFLVSLADIAAERWRETDQGIWEVRGESRHFLYSKVMCWVALDRAIKLAGVLRANGKVGEWKRAQDEIWETVVREGWNESAGAFTQSFGSDALDASNLMLPIVGFLPADDPRMLATIDAIDERLTDERGLVYRYRTEEGVDGLAGSEGTFLLCTFWLAQALALAGRVDRARAVFERAVAYVNDVGLLAEEVDPDSGELLGNFPQAFSHIGLVNAAWAISEAERRLER